VGGAEVPKDRPIDGVDQLDFFLGKHEHSNLLRGAPTPRVDKLASDGFPAYVADRLSAVKWRNWKVHFIWQVNMYDPPLTLPLPKVINLLTDLKEERDGVPWTNSWVVVPVTKIVDELSESLKKYPPIQLGTPDPYSPPSRP
jgi:arylsulfatase